MSLAVASVVTGLLLLPSSASADEAKVFMSSEAWYLELPPCQSLLDCGPLIPPATYPKDTLHVAYTSGIETARTYVSFSLADAASGELTGGTLTLPVDSNPLHGTLLPDQAEIVACLVNGSVDSVQGSVDVPPPADCSVSSPAVYDATGGIFRVSLAPFVPKWTSGTASLAILPSPNPTFGPAVWHVTFYATMQESKDSPPITATLRFAAGSAPPPPTGTGGSVPSTGGGSGPPVSFDGVGMGSPPTVQPPAAPATRVVMPFLGGFAGSGFAYAIVWALPLVLLGGLGALGRALTKSLYRRGL